jgi:negative regulator of replication initiation
MTTVEVSEEVWRYLNSLKGPGDSFDDVLRRELDIGDSGDPSFGAEPRGERGREPMQNAAEPKIVLPEELPHSIDQSEAREVIGRVLELVDDGGPLQRTEIVDRLDDSHSLGYDMDNPRGAWWRRIVRPGLEANRASYTNGHGWS